MIMMLRKLFCLRNIFIRLICVHNKHTSVHIDIQQAIYREECTCFYFYTHIHARVQVVKILLIPQQQIRCLHWNKNNNSNKKNTWREASAKNEIFCQLIAYTCACYNNFYAWKTRLNYIIREFCNAWTQKAHIFMIRCTYTSTSFVYNNFAALAVLFCSIFFATTKNKNNNIASAVLIIY